MADSIPQIEVLQGPHPDPVPRERAGANRQRRLVTFLLGFVLCSTLGLYYVLQRPAVYRASASLLTVAQPDVDQPGIESDVQHVAVQRQLLLGQPLLEEVLRRLEQAANPADAAGGLGIDQLMPMLEVVPVPETNLVELRAEGPDPALLPRLVNTWIDVYVQTS
jgi:succinoglycan biosynthesis transport protein ExoP